MVGLWDEEGRKTSEKCGHEWTGLCGIGSQCFWGASEGLWNTSPIPLIAEYLSIYSSPPVIECPRPPQSNFQPAKIHSQHRQRDVESHLSMKSQTVISWIGQEWPSKRMLNFHLKKKSLYNVCSRYSLHLYIPYPGSFPVMSLSHSCNSASPELLRCGVIFPNGGKVTNVLVSETHHQKFPLWVKEFCFW